MIKLFFLLFAAHAGGDFFLNHRWFSALKRETDWHKKLIGLFAHCFIHSILIFLLLFSWPVAFRVKAALYVGLLHFLIDFLRVYAERFIYVRKDFYIMKKKDALGYLFLGKKDAQSAPFFKKYFMPWLCLTIADQGAHFGVILSLVVLVHRGWF